MKVNFQIRRLVVEGASPMEAQRVAAALRGCLSKLAAAGLAAEPANIARLDAGVLPDGSNAEQIGRHLAGKIFAGVKGARRA